MADFTKAWKYTLKHEGGYVDHKDDPGGATKYGISLRWYKDRVDPDATKETIRDLTEDNAKEIVHKLWWKPFRYYSLLSQDVANRVFSFAYNMGPRNGVRILQRAINKTEDDKIVVDGILGPVTIGAANNIFPPVLLADIRDEAWAYYRRLIERRPELSVFARGWQFRAYD